MKIYIPTVLFWFTRSLRINQSMELCFTEKFFWWTERRRCGFDVLSTFIPQDSRVKSALESSKWVTFCNFRECSDPVIVNWLIGHDDYRVSLPFITLSIEWVWKKKWSCYLQRCSKHRLLWRGLHFRRQPRLRWKDVYQWKMYKMDRTRGRQYAGDSVFHTPHWRLRDLLICLLGIDLCR